MPRPSQRLNLLTLGLLWLLRKTWICLLNESGFVKGDARILEGEIVPRPHDDEVVVFCEFFYVGLMFHDIQFLLEVMQRFG